jgi:hypothetical protein
MPKRRHMSKTAGKGRRRGKNVSNKSFRDGFEQINWNKKEK